MNEQFNGGPIGFIGLGNLGCAIADRLLEAGFCMFIHNRTISKAEHLLRKGAKWSDSFESIIEDVDILFICLSDSTVVEEIFWSDESFLLNALKKPRIIVDFATIPPAEASRFAVRFQKYDIEYVSCPVSGGAEGANTGKLAAILAGSESTRKLILPILKNFSSCITVVETHERAQQLKILNNLAETINLCGALEILRLGKELGSNLNEMQSAFMSCRGSSAYMKVALDYLQSNMSSTKVGFDVRCKDIVLADQLVQADLRFSVSNFVIELYKDLAKDLNAHNDQCDYYHKLIN